VSSLGPSWEHFLREFAKEVPTPRRRVRSSPSRTAFLINPTLGLLSQACTGGSGATGGISFNIFQGGIQTSAVLTSRGGILS